MLKVSNVSEERENQVGPRRDIADINEPTAETLSVDGDNLQVSRIVGV